MGDSYLYPPVQPYKTGILQVSSIHKIYHEESGNRKGIPVVFLHGGPGGATTDRNRQYFDPSAYQIITFDQRGCGKSTPSYCTQDNTTWDIIQDIEKLREHLGIKRWLVFGGSWGSFLALLYAEFHINHVLALILHGVFTFRKDEINWYGQKGASFLFPEYWDEYISPIPEEERHDIFTAFYKRLHSQDKEETLRCAISWSVWEACNTRLRVSPEKIQAVRENPEEALECAKFGMHFYLNHGFLKNRNQIMENVGIIRDSGISVTIVQGRYDVVCPMKTAWELHKKLENSEFHLVDDAGHSPSEMGTTKKLVEACDKYKKILRRDS